MSICGQPILAERNYRVVAKNEGNGEGAIFFYFYLYKTHRQFTILHFWLSLIKKTLSILENR